MANKEALEILRKELECRNSISHSCVINDCNGCQYNVTNVEVTKAIETAIEALELCVMIENDGE